MPDSKTRLLRAKLIMEEAIETIQSLGVEMQPSMSAQFLDMDAITFVESSAGSLVKVVDGCCDIAVVTTGTLSACGVGDIVPQRLVNEANLRKFGPGGQLRSDGKWIKPPDFVGPDRLIQEYLERMVNETRNPDVVSA